MTRRRFVRAILLFSACHATACFGHRLFETSEHVRYSDQAGSVSVAPISVARWDDVSSSLQPTFTMDEPGALAAAIPSTQTLDERFVDLLAASLKVALPTAVSSRATTVSGSPGALQTQMNNSKTRTSGDLSGVSDPGLLAADPGSLAGLPSSSATLGTDPILQHLAATAIFQEVHLLNQYVKNAINYPGAEAFLVRLQLSVLPSRRNLGYDAVTDITFHSDDVEARAGMEPEWAKTEGQANSCSTGWDRLSVIPLLVTDNLESISTARSTQSVQQLGLALMGMISGIGVGGDFSKTKAALKSTFGRDVNSVLTVAKVTDDTVRVRLGAMQSPSHQFVMVPETHDISVMVIYRPCDTKASGSAAAPGAPLAMAGAVPSAAPGFHEQRIFAVARTSYSDVATGKILPAADYVKRWTTASDDIAKKYRINLGAFRLLRYYRLASQQDHTSFFDGIEKDYMQFGADCHGADDQSNLCLDRLEAFKMVDAGIWSEVLSLRSQGEYSFTDIPLPYRYRFPTLASGGLTAIVQNDDKSAIASIGPVRDLQQGRIEAYLQTDAYTPPPVKGKKQDSVAGLKIAAQSVILQPDGTSVSATFPALQPLGADKAAAHPKIEIDFTPTDGTTTMLSQSYAAKVISKLKPDAKTPAFQVTVPAAQIVADTSGHGSVNLVVNANKGDALVSGLTLTITGADIQSVQGVVATPLSAGKTGWSIAAAGETRLTLANLVPGQVVTIGMKGADGAIGDSVTRTVIAPALAKLD